MNSKFKCDYTVIGKRIREKRQEKDYTQVAFAKKIGVASKYMSEVERGERGISVGTLIEISKALEVSTDYLLFGNIITGNHADTLTEGLTTRQKFYAEQIILTFAECCRKAEEKE